MPYIDGLPAAQTVQGTDVMVIDQGGTPNVPGTATAAQVSLTALAAFLGTGIPADLPTIEPVTPGLYWNNGNVVCISG